MSPLSEPLSQQASDLRRELLCERILITPPTVMIMTLTNLAFPGRAVAVRWDSLHRCLPTSQIPPFLANDGLLIVHTRNKVNFTTK